MAGHSKWANIKRRKGAQDEKRGRIWTKLIREITVAARLGGGEPESNPRLRDAIASAKMENMPKDNIQRAIDRGIGATEGANYEEVSYEGYGPGGVAIWIEGMTDNRNRTAGEIRHLFSKHSGNLAENGCVAWMFEKKGLIEVDASSVNEEALFEQATEAGAEDLEKEENSFWVTTPAQDLGKVRDHLTKANFEIKTAQVIAEPQSTVELSEDDTGKMEALMEGLEDHDDVQKVFTNFSAWQ
jgi:YebC/PmpR family DNA-binding regulatory protein